MTMQEAIRLFNNYLNSNHKQRTIDSYVHVLGRFEMIHAQRDLDSIGSDEIYTFLEALTHDLAKSTRRLRQPFYHYSRGIIDDAN